MLWRSAVVLAALMALAIIAIGVRFLLMPETGAAGFGVPAEAGAYLATKGVRDIGAGAVGLALLATGHLRAAGWAVMALSIIPLGDVLVVLAWDGPVAVAYAVHGATAIAMVLVGAVLIRGDRSHRSGQGRPGKGRPSSAVQGLRETA